MRLFRERKLYPSLPLVVGENRSTVVPHHSSGLFLGRQQQSELIHPRLRQQVGGWGQSRASSPPAPTALSLTSSELFQPHCCSRLLQLNPSSHLGNEQGGHPQPVRTCPGLVSAIRTGRRADTAPEGSLTQRWERISNDSPSVLADPCPSD